MQAGERRSPLDEGANPLLVRVRAAEATLARFNGRRFAWGEADCLRVAAFHLRQLGRAPPLREAGRYATMLGARRALKRTGHASLEAWVDSWGLRRIASAFVLPGDVVAYRGLYGDMPALTVALTNGRVFGFLGETAIAMTATDPVAAWSVG